MKEHSRVSVSAALLLLLLGGCATTGVESGGRVSPEQQEVTALFQAFVDRINLRSKWYFEGAAKAKSEITQAATVLDVEKTVRLVSEISQLEGRMKFLANFKEIPAGITVHQWFAGQPDRIKRMRADTERYMARVEAWLVDNPHTAIDIGLPIFQQGKGIPGPDNIDGEEMEAKLVAQELDAYSAAVDDVYQRADDRKIAEDLAQQQSLLLLFGGLQQINYNLQEQDRYNQQQRYQQEQQFYQQQLLYELSKPTRCYTFGATTTCN